MDHPTQLSWALAGEPGLSLPRPALDLGHREPARRRLPQAARRLPHRDRQRRLVLADRRADQHGRGSARCRACAERRSTRRSPTRPRATSGSPRWSSSRPTRRTASRSAAARDIYGVPVPRLTYRLDDYTKAGFAASVEAHDAIFAQARRERSPAQPGRAGRRPHHRHRADGRRSRDVGCRSRSAEP